MVEVTSNWGPREGPQRSDAEEAVVATWDMMARVAGETRWYPQGQRPQHPVNQTDVPQLLEAGRNHDDGSGDIIESLGRSIALYDTEGSSLTAATDGFAKSWVGHAAIRRAGLPSVADEAWPLLEEQLLLWSPRTATWGSKGLRKMSRRHGLSPFQPRLGLLTWVRDDVESPFTGGDKLQIHGGTLYRFGDRLEEVTEQIVGAVLRP